MFPALGRTAALQRNLSPSASQGMNERLINGGGILEVIFARTNEKPQTCKRELSKNSTAVIPQCRNTLLQVNVMHSKFHLSRIKAFKYT